MTNQQSYKILVQLTTIYTRRLLSPVQYFAAAPVVMHLLLLLLVTILCVFLKNPLDMALPLFQEFFPIS